ncbi:hypothetical protein BS50DRAFT_507566 [Corynespora cassiicola Philippines]|uniref:DDE-1 domain-containing protein n=1 Tax=Corynespora cassiicola Philippines TaxID=1448308 RepID=A0A2T2N3C6_CORCC|nr:hypothetical protein BS50DRAFT_507566 [Corynespora cassiicola Philippines]
MKGNCHKADSGEGSRLYFEHLLREMAQHKPGPDHACNIDENAFAIEVTRRSKGVFDKQLYVNNGEWVALLACICENGTALPPSTTHAATGRAVQAS